MPDFSLNRSFYGKTSSYQAFKAPYYTPNVVKSDTPWTVGPYLDSKQGTDVDGWDWKISHLQSATSDYTRIVPEARLGYVRYICTKKDNVKLGDAYTESYEGTFLSTCLDPGTSSRAYETALGNFLKDAGEQLSPLKGGIVLGELRDTLRMIRNPLQALRNGILAYLKRARSEILKARKRKGRRKLNVGGANELRKVLSKTWLEYSFGWNNLVLSIEQAVNAYAQLNADIQTVRASGGAKDELVLSVSKTPMTFGLYGYAFRTDKTESVVKVKFKGVAKLQLDGIKTDEADRVRQACGFNLAEFVPTVWELIPLSWVADMFTNAGDILNSIHGLSSQWVWKTVATTATTTSKRDYMLDWAKIDAVRSSVPKQEQVRLLSPNLRVRPSSLKRTSYVRSDPTLRLPSLVMSLPGSNFQWANLLAYLNTKI